MGLLVNCPQCGCAFAKGTICPRCHHADNAQAEVQEHSLREEFSRCYAEHYRNYAIYMGLAFGLGLVTLLLGGFVYVGEGGWLVLIVLLVAWLVLCFLTATCQRWWPIELHCPACDQRLDEIGFGTHCPHCHVHLRDQTPV